MVSGLVFDEFGFLVRDMYDLDVDGVDSMDELDNIGFEIVNVDVDELNEIRNGYYKIVEGELYVCGEEEDLMVNIVDLCDEFGFNEEIVRNLVSNYMMVDEYKEERGEFMMDYYDVGDFLNYDGVNFLGGIKGYKVIKEFVNRLKEVYF